MKRVAIYLTLFLGIALSFGFMPKVEKSKRQSVLIFSLTKGFHHASIADGIIAIKKLGTENGFDVDTSNDVKVFEIENLKKYKTLIFLSPTGSNVFNDIQKAALKQYINNGGGFVGVHAASDFCYEWEWYGKMVGGYFESHPKTQEAKLNVITPKNKIVKGLPNSWLHKDEWYNFKDFNPAVKVLIKVDESSYTGGTMKNDHPISWYHEYDGGKVFYTALGHTKECYTDVFFLKHLLAGIKWTMK
ncbi:ThuA domain-containing protein [Pedobacter frigiditerrae]|uniref:ThuA domain-containing protein n=1 Tax=Pedobacter frigiditerrae TaxID=2530452 RepID=A0A4R0MMV8_9SPHI|nr:ThuA domain-containing protein [Pedobacter frigiditerrae]TCC88089.1 ThuA domain-containing protein [Pedobacter frigiditerrae]